jgi:hypothetical protein
MWERESLNQCLRPTGALLFLPDEFLARVPKSGSDQLQVGFAQKTSLCICSNDLQRPARVAPSVAITDKDK